RLRTIIQEGKLAVRRGDELAVADDIRERDPTGPQVGTPLHLEQVVRWRKPREEEVVRSAHVGAGNTGNRRHVRRWRWRRRRDYARIQQDELIEAPGDETTSLRAIIKEFELAVRRIDELVIADNVRKGIPVRGQGRAPLHLE